MKFIYNVTLERITGFGRYSDEMMNCICGKYEVWFCSDIDMEAA